MNEESAWSFLIVVIKEARFVIGSALATGRITSDAPKNKQTIVCMVQWSPSYVTTPIVSDKGDHIRGVVSRQGDVYMALSARVGRLYNDMG